MINDMWLVDVGRPWREPFLAYGCTIKICEKQIVVSNERCAIRHFNHTFIYDSSAFGTYEAAQRRLRGLLKRMIERCASASYGRRGYMIETLHQARVALLRLKETIPPQP